MLPKLTVTNAFVHRFITMTKIVVQLTQVDPVEEIMSVLPLLVRVMVLAITLILVVVMLVITPVALPALKTQHAIVAHAKMVEHVPNQEVHILIHALVLLATVELVVKILLLFVIPSHVSTLVSVPPLDPIIGVVIVVLVSVVSIVLMPLEVDLIAHPRQVQMDTLPHGLQMVLASIITPIFQVQRPILFKLVTT